LRFRNFLPLVAAALIGTACPAEGSFALRYSTDGGATFTTVTDNGAGDTDTTTPDTIGVSIGAISIKASSSNFISPDLTTLDLALSGAAAKQTTYNLVIQASVTGINTAP